MRTQPPEEHTGRMTSPDLRFRTSVTMWGPLQLTLTNHREGAELGYAAGQAAYHEESDYCLEDAMYRYLHTPRYRPRATTPTIIAEWQAMFLLGWTSGLLERSASIRTDEQTDEPAHALQQYEASRPRSAGSAFIAQGRGKP